jgi:glutathione S-transferase
MLNFAVYAEKAEADASKEAFLFNCAQRKSSFTEYVVPFILTMILIGAHQNTIEHMPLIIVTSVFF